MTQHDLTHDISLPRLAFRLGLDPARLARARERVRDYLWLHCDDERVVDEVVLCVEEACTNAIRHSGAKEAMEVSLGFNGDDLLVIAKDSGQGFEVASFDRDALPDPLASGGRGLFLMARLMDELELRLDGGLEVRMLKRSVSCSPSSAPLDPALGNSAGTRQRVRTQLLLEEIGEAFFALDWEYRYIHANRVALQLTGKSLEQLRGHTPWELFPGLDDSRLQSAYREAMEVGKPAVLEHCSVVTGDWLEVRIYPTGVGVSAYYREINERKAVEEELRRYRMLAQQARDIMLFVRYADGRILEANVAAEKAYGYSKVELLALSISELRAPEASPSVRDQMAAASEKGILFETLHRRADGSVFPVEVSSQGTNDIDGERVLLSIVRDVSERQSAKVEVRESEQRYRSLFENMLDGYAYCRMIYEDGAPADFVYLDVNSAFERLTGLRDAVGRKVTEIIPGVRQDNPELFEIYGRVAHSGQPESFETYLESLGIWFSVSVYSPQAQHFVAIFENTTERKRAEEDRKHLLEESQAQTEELRGIYEAQRDIALALQENFVHPLPVVAGLDLAALSLPAGREELIGGDFSDVLARPDGTVVALIGDVTGKGIPAAGFTETVRAAVRVLALISPSPEYILGNVNRLLLHEGEHQQLATALLVVFDPRSGQGTMASAGHPPAVHLSQSACRTIELSYGLPLGVLEQGYTATGFTLAPGEALVLYTDGVTEARRAGELFGEKRLLEVLGAAPDRGPRQLIERLRAAVIDYADELKDDLQILALRRTQ